LSGWKNGYIKRIRRRNKRDVLGQERGDDFFENFVPTVSALDLNKEYLESITASLLLPDDEHL
jgi:hypothetical protein